jgi:hypothetical protein
MNSPTTFRPDLHARRWLWNLRRQGGRAAAITRSRLMMGKLKIRIGRVGLYNSSTRHLRAFAADLSNFICVSVRDNGARRRAMTA